MAIVNNSNKKSPLYYGTTKKPVYYGTTQMPYYYGSNVYGGMQQDTSGGDGDSIVGAISISRMLRVITQRWLTVLVMLLLGVIGAFAVYRISPTIYQATAEFTMEMPKASGFRSAYITDVAQGPDYGSSYDEIFNTRLPDWRSAAIVKDIIDKFHAEHPTSTVEDKEITACLAGSRISIVRMSRRISVSVSSESAELAAQLANTYVRAIEQYTQKENVIRTERAVAQISALTAKQEEEVVNKNRELLNFRRAHKLDNYRTTRQTLGQTLSAITSDILRLESAEVAAAEWQNVLAAVQNNPDSFGSLPSSVPRSQEIASAWDKYQNLILKKGTMLATETAKHPSVKALERETEVYKEQFAETVRRAFETSKGNLAAIRNQLKQRRADRDEINQKIAAIDSRIVEAESGISQREDEKSVASSILKDLRQRLNQARIRASQDLDETINIGSPATVPSTPIYPKPVLIFSVGIGLGLAVGIFLVLVVDHLEDTVISISDIEQRLALKVLAVLPHIRRKKRQQVAKFIIEDKYSQFAESVAGLRNLLDSPRYQDVSKCILCISTQPGEGKTVTSSSLAISSAQTGRRTLLVDFDLRRPRGAGIWELNLTEETSLSHALTKGDPSVFPKLVNHIEYAHLDVVASLAPDGINPSSLMGSSIITQFFAWARANYDRIIIDSPPYGIVGDVMTLASMVDSVIIMCCPDRTRFRPIQQASRQLTESGAMILGIVVNDVDISNFSSFKSSSYNYGYGYGGYGYGGYGYGYGYGYKSSSKKKSASGKKTQGQPGAPEKEKAAPDASKSPETAEPAPSVTEETVELEPRRPPAEDPVFTDDD